MARPLAEIAKDRADLQIPSERAKETPPVPLRKSNRASFPAAVNPWWDGLNHPPKEICQSPNLQDIRMCSVWKQGRTLQRESC